MKTLANVVIKKESSNWTDYVQIIHLWDGYPSYLGDDLLHFVNELYNSMSADELLSLSTMEVAEKLNEYDSSYQIEDKFGLHGDIKFLYVIDLLKLTITCYVFKEFYVEDAAKFGSIGFVEGIVPFTDYYYLVYCTNFSDDAIPEDAQKL